MRKHILFAGLFAAIALAGVAGCTTAQPRSTVAALETSLTVLEAGGTAYIQLPLCGGASEVCSDPAVSARIKAADVKAYTAVKAARAATANGGGDGSTQAAAAAVAALRTLIPGI